MRLIVLFEDHTLQGFRTMGWSVPVYEIPCGLFNLRERVLSLVAEGPRSDRVVLLPRTLLEGLQALAVPGGATCGLAAVNEAVAVAESVLFLCARLGPDWEQLRVLLGRPAPFALRDEDGLLAAAVDPAAGRRLLDDWRSWESAQAARGAWTEANQAAEPWLPALDATDGKIAAWRHLWDLVPAIGRAVADDKAAVVAAGRGIRRLPFGIAPDPSSTPAWRQDSFFRPYAGAPGVHLVAA